MDEFRNDNSQLNDNFDAVKDDSDDIAVDTVHQPGEAARDAENTAMHDISPEAGIPDVAVRGAASGEEPQTEHRYPYEGSEAFDSQAGGPAYAGKMKQPYYSENIKKTRERRPGAGYLIIVSLLSSILGAAIMFAAIVYITPMIGPKAVEMLGLPVRTAGVSGSESGIIKKIEIAETTSPVTAIAEKVGPSIVGIQITVPTRSDYSFFFDISRDGVGYGSGIIIREDGYILTNNHVIEAAMSGQLSNKLRDGAKIEVILPDNKNIPYKAELIGRDEKTDIAVLKIDVSGLPAAELGDSDAMKVGELAVAIGNPGGMDYMGSVTAGVISGINRTITMSNGREFRLLQTDAAINPGNSGGALANSRGEVIGINTIKIAATDVEGIGFAIPINEAREIAESLIAYRYVKDRPYLGVVIDNTFTKEDAESLKVPNGLLVYDVQPLTAAYKAGIHIGDIIVKFDGKEVTTFKELEDLKNQHKPGDEVEVEVYRDGEIMRLKVVLGEEKNID
jgi:serine protease Do